MENATKALEQIRVDAVMAKLHQRLATIATQIKEAHQDTALIEQSYGDATKVNITEIDDRMETNAAVQQQKMMVARAVENETILSHEQNRLTRLSRNPYFGRIDITDEGTTETMYIGTGTFMDQDNQFLVYDWRAPIASVYYNGTLGPVSYDTPVGKQTVTLDLKRQFMIEHGRITNMFDTNETVGDEILQAVLGNQTDDYMQNIVATIQKEQNDIIRDTSADVLVVQGVAGSGKTSAVLQRVAYLLYHARAALDADQMVLFSPNQLFANYISAVLPSLGEKNMRQATMYEFFAKRFNGLHVQTLFERFEQDAANLPEATKRMRRFKESAGYLDLVRDYANHVPVPYFVDIMLNGEVFFSAKTIAKIYAKQPAAATAANKFLDTKNTLIRRLRTRIKLAAYEDWVQERLDLLSDDQARAILGDKEFADGDQEARYIAEAVVADAFAPVYDAIYNDYFLDEYQEYQRFLDTVCAPGVDPEVWSAMTQAYANDLEAHQLRLEDAAPILYLRNTIAGSGQNHQIQYLFVDEMQDYSMCQLRYLHYAFPKAKLTLLGDAKQDVFTANYRPSDFIHEMKQVFAGMKVELISLNKSYRSTRPITNFGKALLPKSDHILAFNRDGEKPRVLTVTQDAAMAALTQLTNTLLRSNHTVAILTKNHAAATKLFATLKIDTPTHLLSPADHTMHSGCLILPVYLAKGLEFDAVIGWDVSKATYGTEADRDILYTLTTRALHQLILIGIDAPSPLVAELSSELYTPQTLTKIGVL